jgi:hypothetical protein
MYRGRRFWLVDADPESHTSVLDAVRAGWLMAELRGRLRPGGPPPQGAVLDRTGHTLPLPSERSPTEQAIELRRVLTNLSVSLGLAMPPSGSPVPVPFTERLEDAAKTLDDAREKHEDAGSDVAWEAVAELIHTWDAALQDALAGRSVDVSRAYELGRTAGSFSSARTASTSSTSDFAAWHPAITPPPPQQSQRLSTRGRPWRPRDKHDRRRTPPP